MKKIILFTLLSLGMTLYSQETKYGISAAISVTGIDNDFRTLGVYTTDITAPKGVGYSLSGFYDFQLNSSLGLIGNISLDKRAVDFQEPRVLLSYLKLNPALKFDTNKNYGSGFYIKPGVYYAMLLSSKKKKQTEADINEYLKNSIYGVNLGLGVDLSKRIGIELIFDYSLSNSLKEIDNLKIKSKFLSGYFSLLLNIDEFI